MVSRLVRLFPLDIGYVLFERGKISRGSCFFNVGLGVSRELEYMSFIMSGVFNRFVSSL